MRYNVTQETSHRLVLSDNEMLTVRVALERLCSWQIGEPPDLVTAWPLARQIREALGMDPAVPDWGRPYMPCSRCAERWATPTEEPAP